MSDDQRGTLAFSGAVCWADGIELDRQLAESAGGPVVIVPTGAAYERPDRLISEATEHFGSLGTEVRTAMVVRRSDAEDPNLAEMIRRASFLYLCGGSPLHLRSVLKDSLVLDALVGAWRDGAIVAGQGAGTVTLSDPMVDPRGGAYTVGLGLVRNIAVIPSGTLGESSLRRTISLLPSECALVELAPGAAVLRTADGMWASIGEVDLYIDRSPAGLEALAGKPVW